MNCELPPPGELRDAAHIRAALTEKRQGYVPAWQSVQDAGIALHAALARNLEIQREGLHWAPLRMQLEFLDSIGLDVLPAQPARTPLVFTLLPNAAADAAVPAGTRVGAVLPPPAPGLEADTAASSAAAPEFFTEQQITAMRGRIAALYSIDPQADSYADHAAGTPETFAVFDTGSPVPHRLHLGHSALFNLAGTAEIVLTCSFGSPATRQRPLLLDWEYLSMDGWLPLELVEDGTARFTQDGIIVLRKGCGPDSRTDSVGGVASCWIRATVSARTPGARIVSAAAQPDAQGLYALEVESAIELLPGDVLTADGFDRASVRHVFAGSLRLDAPLPGARPGAFALLADALPPLRPEGADEAGALPQLDVIRARVGFTQSDIALDSARLDGFTLDISKDFHPFGEQPRPYAALYLACKSAFGRTGARVELVFTYTLVHPAYADGTAQPPRMQAEYFRGGRWLPLGPDHEYVDGTLALTAPTAPDTASGTIAFVSPLGWEESEVGGEKQLWLRLRLVEGDYGHPLSVSVEPDPADPARYVVTSLPATLRPPLVARVGVSYTYFTHPAALEHCVCENDFAFVDRSEDARWPRRPFTPFTPVSDQAPALHVGFAERPPAALVSLLVHVLEPAADGAPQPLVWDYWGSRGWSELSVRDTTDGLRRTGLVQFVGAPDMLPRDGLGGALYRIRARLKSGLEAAAQAFRCGGVWLNAVWASHGRRSEREPLGTSDGSPDQTFALPLLRAAPGPAAPVVAGTVDFERALDLTQAGVPVQAGEIVEVREWSGRGEDWRSTLHDVAPGDLRFERDPKDPTVATAAWVRWHAAPHFYRSGAQDRHYVVERATGVFRFPGPGGFVPPAGCPIVASYVTGGGVEGNVPAHAVRELRGSVSYVEAVFNPLPAAGGAAAEVLRAARARGTQWLRHRDRAVSADDYAVLALGASSEVACACALPLEGPDGHGMRGQVAVAIVPHSHDAMPMPSMQLAETVRRHLVRRAPAGIAAGVRVLPPRYVPVGVRAELQPRTAEEAATVEARVRAALTRFLHPGTGGAHAHGWAFGQGAHLSDVAALLCAVEGVGTVLSLRLLSGPAMVGDAVPLEPDQLVCAGDIQLRIVLPGSTYDAAA